MTYVPKKKVIYVAYVTRNGVKDYARNHGFKAWRIEVEE